MVGVLFSRCGEGWLWVSRGSSGLRGDSPGVAPSEAQRAGHLKKPQVGSFFPAPRCLFPTTHARRHEIYGVAQACHHCFGRGDIAQISERESSVNPRESA